MKAMRLKKYSLRRGAGVLLSVGLFGVSVTLMTTGYIRKVSNVYGSARSLSDGLRARELAEAGFETALLVITKIPEQFLFTEAIVGNPPSILLSKSCTKGGRCIGHYIRYSVVPEDGKLNLNHLVRYDGEPDSNYVQIFERLFESFDLKAENVGAIVDWLDENTNLSLGGAESNYYESLEPSLKIKNTYMYSLSELSILKHFNRDTVYAPRIPDGWEERQKELAFQTETEESLLNQDDWILANNITAYLPYQLLGTDKININAARYHVLLSLSNAMTRKAVLAVFKLRQQENGYIQSLDALKTLPEFQAEGGGGGVTLYEEVVGTGGATSGFLKVKSRFYRITGIGSITVLSDNSEEESLAVRRVSGIWDKDRKTLIYYSED